MIAPQTKVAARCTVQPAQANAVGGVHAERSSGKLAELPSTAAVHRDAAASAPFHTTPVQRSAAESHLNKAA